MAFSPDSSCRHDQNTRDANAAKMVSGEQGGSGESDFLIVSDGDCVCGQDGREGCAEDCDEGDDGEDEIAAP